MTPAPKSRWFRFSLRTLFVAVTVVGCGLGYGLNWMRQRHDFLRQRDVSYSNTDIWIGTELASITAPWPLRLLGENGYPTINLHLIDDERAESFSWHWTDYESAERTLKPHERGQVNHARRLFPESQVYVRFKESDD